MEPDSRWLRYALAGSLLMLLTVSLLHAGGPAPAVIGEHLDGFVLETPHPYPAGNPAVPTLVHQDYFEFPGARHLVFTFQTFHLAPGDWLEIIDGQGRLVERLEGLGSGRRGGGFISHMVFGGEATLNLYSVNAAHGHYGYRIHRITRGFNDEELRALYGRTDKAIMGADDKLDAACYETVYPIEYHRGRAVARIVLNSGAAHCTGWLVSCQGHLITNNHCIQDQAQLDTLLFQFMYERPDCGSGTATVEYELKGIDCTFLETNAGLDYTLIAPPAGVNPADIYGYLALDDRLADLEEQIYIAGHPADKPKEFSLESTHPEDQTGFCEIHSHDEPSCTGSPVNDEIGYYADTESGSSGSPVLSRATQKVVALHHCAGSGGVDPPNRGVRIQNIWDSNQAGAHPLPACSLNYKPGIVLLDRAVYNCADTVIIYLQDESLMGHGTQNITIASDTETTPETVSLTEDPADSGIFSGTIDTTAGAPAGDGFLSLSHADILTVQYIDADDGLGGTNVLREDTAAADCQAPLISGVAVSDITEQSAVVSWTTDEPSVGAVWVSDHPAHWQLAGTTATYQTGHTVEVTGLAQCTTYYFWVEAADTVANTSGDDNGGAFYTFATLRAKTLFLDNMESGTNGWTATGSWALTDEDSRSPSHCWTDSPGGDYNRLTTINLSMPSLDFTSFSHATLTFWHHYTIDTVDDFGQVRVSTDGSSWDNLAQFSGAQASWTQAVLDLSAYAGQPAVQIRFFFNAGRDYVTADGWYIDDVTIGYATDCSLFGDLNDDGFVDAVDLLLLADYLAGNPADFVRFEADFNNDLTIDANDLAELVHRLNE